MEFHNLKFDLYSKACINDATCSCRSDNEDARHYFLKCPLCFTKRHTMVIVFSRQLNLVATLP